MLKKLATLLLISVFISPFAFAGRISRADKVASKYGFTKSLVQTDPFLLTAYYRIKVPGKPIRIYVEGDGRTWIKRKRLSGNPTPRKPLVLELAGLDPSDNVVYLARPCQYTPKDMEPAYNSDYWSGKIFSDTVISSMDQAIEKFKNDADSREIELIGYSGGAAVAALIASRRGDIASLRTVAGNLDHEEVTRYHRTSPLRGSLNPIDAAPSLAKLPQRHFVGEKDRVVPPFIARGFARRVGDNSCISVTEVQGCTHNTGWRKRWQELLAIPVVCIENKIGTDTI